MIYDMRFIERNGARIVQVRYVSVTFNKPSGDVHSRGDISDWYDLRLEQEIYLTDNPKPHDVHP